MKKITTTAEYNAVQLENDKRRAKAKGEGYKDSLKLRRAAISQHACESFFFMVKDPYRDHAIGIKLSKEQLLQMAGKILIPSTVKAGGEVKHGDVGKMCYRFNIEILRTIAKNMLEFGIADIIPLGMSWKAWEEETRKTALRHNAGCGAEEMICARYGWKQIGESDGKDHTKHTDAVEADGKMVEIKLETGYLRDQYWRKDWGWI